MWAGFGSPEASHPGGQLAAFSPCPCRVVPLCARSPALCARISSSYRDTSQAGLGPPPRASFELITSLKTLPPKALAF